MKTKYKVEYAIGAARNPVRFEQEADDAAECETIVARLLEDRCAPRSIKRNGRGLPPKEMQTIMKDAKALVAKRHLQALGLGE